MKVQLKTKYSYALGGIQVTTWNAGDVAELPDAVAEKLIERGDADPAGEAIETIKEEKKAPETKTAIEEFTEEQPEVIPEPHAQYVEELELLDGVGSSLAQQICDAVEGGLEAFYQVTNTAAGVEALCLIRGINTQRIGTWRREAFNIMHGEEE